jgi:thiol:disulfide interchange protein
MVPVTVSYFSKRTDTSATRAAIVYCMGIVGAFAVVGVLVTVLFGAGSIQSFAANPWVNLTLAILFIAMALNLFGLYEIQLPSGLINKLNTKSRTSGSLVGPLLMGMTFALTTFTCTAPIVGTVLAASTSGNLFYPALGMTSFGLAFSLPFLALALFPSYLNKMPKSGSWLGAVKPALGFIELMAAVKFLSNADLVWHLGLLTRPVFLITWAVLAFLLAAYLLGLPKSINKVGLTRRGLGLATLVLACFLSLGATGRPIKGNLGAFLPPDPYPVQSGQEGPKMDVASTETYWESDFKTALARAQAENKVVFLDFTGVTCVNCRLMEQDVFPDPSVKERFGEMVTAKLYTDRGTEEDMANQELQKKLAKTIALPVYVLLKPDGTTVIGKYEGLAPSPDEFVKFLDAARSSS